MKEFFSDVQTNDPKQVKSISEFNASFRFFQFDRKQWKSFCFPCVEWQNNNREEACRKVRTTIKISSKKICRTSLNCPRTKIFTSDSNIFSLIRPSNEYQNKQNGQKFICRLLDETFEKLHYVKLFAWKHNFDSFVWVLDCCLVLFFDLCLSRTIEKIQNLLIWKPLCVMCTFGNKQKITSWN